FAQCMALMSFVYKFVLCFVFRRMVQRVIVALSGRRREWSSSQWLGVKNVIYHGMSGFMSAVVSSHMFIPHKYLKLVALYCMVRCLADLLRVLQVFQKLVEIPHMSSIMFTCAQIPIMHAFLNEPSKMNPKFYKWVLSMGNLQQIQARVFQSLFKYDEFMPFLNCSPTFHIEHSCFKAHFLDWLHCLLRAGKMYLPVHFLPLLLLSPKKVLKQPASYVAKKSLSTLQSSIFLSTYQFNMKLTECWGRHLLQRDPSWLSMIGGLNSGLSILLEKKERRPELVLYVIPQALEIFDETYQPHLARWKTPPTSAITRVHLWINTWPLDGAEGV
ncbi:hypothetical protein RFI_21319, partial [Reticulomyxa filosa]